MNLRIPFFKIPKATHYFWLNLQIGIFAAVDGFRCWANLHRGPWIFAAWWVKISLALLRVSWVCFVCYIQGKSWTLVYRGWYDDGCWLLWECLISFSTNHASMCVDTRTWKSFIWPRSPFSSLFTVKSDGFVWLSPASLRNSVTIFSLANWRVFPLHSPTVSNLRDDVKWFIYCWKSWNRLAGRFMAYT